MQRATRLFLARLHTARDKNSLLLHAANNGAGRHTPYAESGDEPTAYRGVTMRGSYMAQDRPERRFATKELARDMAKPTNASKKALKAYVSGEKPDVSELLGKGSAKAPAPAPLPPVSAPPPASAPPKSDGDGTSGDAPAPFVQMGRPMGGDGKE